MPAVIDAPEVVEYEEHDLYEEQPQVCIVRAGFWHNLVQYIRQYRFHRLHATSSSSHVSLHQVESPMAHLAQEHPTLYLLGFCGIHSG